MDTPEPRRLIILGCTGSIGVNALDVVANLDASSTPGPRFDVVGLAAGTRAADLDAQCTRFTVADAAIAEKEKFAKLYTEMQKLAEERQTQAEGSAKGGHGLIAAILADRRDRAIAGVGLVAQGGGAIVGAALEGTRSAQLIGSRRGRARGTSGGARGHRGHARGGGARHGASARNVRLGALLRGDR